MINKASAHRSPPLNWRALEPVERFMARRSADRDEWVVGWGMNGKGSTLPSAPGMGHLAFHYAEAIDRWPSRHPDPVWAGSHWWTPTVMFRLTGPELRPIIGNGGEETIHHLLREVYPERELEAIPSLMWTPCTQRAAYLARVEKLLAHIQRGDIYEVNYCTERKAHAPHFDPYAAFGRLLTRMDAPFAGFYRDHHRFVLCMSPERFLRIENGRVFTQPMKGTRKRSGDATTDRSLARQLAEDPKERSENIMAVDVARHDLSRVAASGSVQVDELCAVKSYAQVHQLVSTVSARLRDGSTVQDALRAAYPMASMTGAPKRRALQLIDEVEDMPRGIFSGCLGYVLPDGTMDLNVVIRTITFDERTGALSLITGSAITAQSDPQQEWEECELKAASVLNALI